jgi:sulfite reductase alpha subunit-like flavoprotein
VKDLLETKRDELMVSLMYEDLINKKATITYDRQQKFYEDNKEGMRQPERRKFGVVVTKDLDTAHRAQAELLEGRNVSAVASTYSTDGPTLETLGQTDLIIRGQKPELDAVGFAMTNVGDVSTPFQVDTGWMVVKLMELQPERIFSFEEAQERIEAALREQDNDDRLNELLKKWSEEYKVVLHEDNLKKVKLPQRLDEQMKERRGDHAHKDEVSSAEHQH